MKSGGFALGALVLAAPWLAACGATGLRNQELERVAKDWALVIRASQVIPVYPLTEDLQPGDLLLASLPAEEEVRIYSEKGFLPLDQHLARLHPTGYAAFYAGRHGVTDDAQPPAHWQGGASRPPDWSSAPRAAFPSYRFSVEAGGGLELAVPVSGLPLALGLMRSSRASGSLTIAEAFTYGIERTSLEREVRAWASENQDLLRRFGPKDGRVHYLRTVHRVYLASRVEVIVSSEDALGAQATGGSAPDGSPTGQEEAERIERLGLLLQRTVPGGRLQVASASSRAVTLSERFAQPLVIGYQGFDLPILEGGRLGAPSSTLERLTGRALPQPLAPAGTFRLAAIAHLYNALMELEGEEAARVRAELDQLALLLPETLAFHLYEDQQDRIGRNEDLVPGAWLPRGSFQDVVDFLGHSRDSAAALEHWLPQQPRETRAEAAELARMERDLALTRAAIRQLESALAHSPELMRAIDFVILSDGQGS